MKKNDVTNFYFIIGIPSDILFNKLKIFDELSKNKEIPRLSILETSTLDDITYQSIIFCYEIDLYKRKQYEIKLAIQYNKLNFTSNAPIKFNPEDYIFYYENIEFPIYKKSFFSSEMKEPPKLLKYNKKEIFEQYIKYFVSKGKNKLDIFLDKAFHEFVSTKEMIKTDNYDFMDDFFNTYSIYKMKIYLSFLKEIINRIMKEKEATKLRLIKFFLSNFNKRNLPSFQNDIFENIFSDNIDFITKNIETILYFFNYIQFHDNWFGKIFDKTDWENFKINNLDCHHYLERIFRLIKYPSFILDKLNNKLSNEEKLRKIFRFLNLFNIENFPFEYSMLIPSNQIGFYKILCKESYIDEKKFPPHIFIEINNFNELNNWFNGFLKNNIKTALKIIMRNKEYIYYLSFKENKKIFINNDLLDKDINEKNEILAFKKAIEYYMNSVNYNFIEFEENTDDSDKKEKLITYNGIENIYNQAYSFNCQNCLFFVNKEILEKHILNECYTSSLMCFNCFKLIPINDYINHNKCFRSEEFYQREINKLLKIFTLENYIFLDYYFEKDEFYKTKSFDNLIKKICNNLGNDKHNRNFEVLKFFENYFIEKKFDIYYDLLIEKMGDFVYKKTNTPYWFDVIKYLSKKLIERKHDSNYINLMNCLINTIITLDFTKRDNWFEILEYFKNEFLENKKSISYDYLVKKLIPLFCNISFTSNQNYFNYVNYFNKEFLTNNDMNHYNDLMRSLIFFINSEIFYQKNNWYDYVLFFEKQFIEKGHNNLLNELYMKVNELLDKDCLVLSERYFEYIKHFLERYLQYNNQLYDILITIIFNLIQNHILYEKNDFFSIAKYISNQLYQNNIKSFMNFLDVIIYIVDANNFIIKEMWFDVIKFFDAIILEYKELYEKFITKIISVIKWNILFSKNDWFEVAKYFEQKLSERNMIEKYNIYIKVIINLIPTKEFVEKRRDWFNIIQYFEEKLKKNIQYDTFGNLIINVILEKYIKELRNWFEIVKFLMKSFGDNKKYKLYENLSLKIIPVIVNEYFYKKNNYLWVVQYLDNSFIQYNFPSLKTNLFSSIINKYWSVIGTDINLFKYFFEFGQYSLNLSTLLFYAIKCNAYFKGNINFYNYEEFVFKRLKNLPYSFYNEKKIQENLDLVFLFLKEYNINGRFLPYFIFFCSELQHEYIQNYIYKKNDNDLNNKVEKIIFPFKNSSQIKNWIYESIKKNNSLITLKILLRNKEFIYILCERDYTSISFIENNNEFINNNNNEFYFLIKCFKNYMKKIDCNFIEFSENLNSLSYIENNLENNKLKRCDICGFHLLNDFYLEHINSNCEFSNIFSCFRCFLNYDAKSFIKHKEKLCVKNNFYSRLEAHEKKIADLKGEINYIYQRLKTLDTKTDNNAKNINQLNNDLYKLENSIKYVKDDLNFYVKSLGNDIKDLDSKLVSKINNVNSSISNCIKQYNEMVDENNQINRKMRDIESKIDSLRYRTYN